MYDRIYVCHTFYHVYIACLKEFALGKKGGATLMLSKMSNRFGTMVDRAKKSPIFDEVYEYDEKEDTFFEELKPLKTDSGNIAINMLRRIRFCKKFGKLQEKFVPVDFSKYKDIYVFCDSDPIGYYLSYKKIRYHALEDGLDCIRYYDTARYDNRGHFNIKAKMAELGLIHIQNGYGKYCIDMEVNDISVLQYPCPKYVELPRKNLTERLTASEKELLLELFVEDIDKLRSKLDEAKKGLPTLLVLSEPLCDLDTRRRIFEDIIRDYGTIDGQKAIVLIKQHPRDLLEYNKIFRDAVILDGSFPMEMLNLIEGLSFDRVVSVYTVTDSIKFAKEKLYLGDDFMDIYEAPEIHRQNEAI
ncbi:glycosyltransferase family 52 protein [Butyrivibrio sp. DSM 10294]|uniref:glycosyltransferase family 52 n=1 Tax=Butyrivibrio sp. DSM 10294 TaxID=2972457 RepID=UPI00234ECD73|nr:glycosyltransferase family 52 [Butyrivibrio sp. DSM 10294]MDC7292951.1 glycosyltransferase family 52 protein [Butyrivibrio sp. DSM 10294]